MKFLTIDGRSLHCAYRPGSGRPVVFANSLGTDLRIWDGVAALLPEDRPLLMIDKRGHGLSSLGPVTIAALAQDIAAAMDHYGLSGAVACGVSVGGMIMQSLAVHRPDLISAAVLCCTGLKIGDEATWTPRIDAARTTGIATMRDAVMERWFSPGFRASRQGDLEGYSNMLVRTDAESYARVCEAIRDCDLTAEAVKITQPVVCIAGSDDLATPPALVHELAAALPDARCIEIPDCGHLPCIEAPQTVAEAILSL
jgi:3-oxoadipate enol-lactonase